jgi:ATP-binding cassette, subfamily C, bacterial
MVTASRFQTLKVVQFGHYIFKNNGARTLWALGFLLLGSLTEGISIIFLVKVLQVMGSEGGEVSIPQPIKIFSGLTGSEIRLGLLPTLAFLVMLAVVQALFVRFKNIRMAELLYDIINELRISLFESIGRARWQFIARQRGSDLNHLLTADIDRVQGAAFSLLMLIQSCVILCVYVCVSVVISPEMTVFASLLGLSALAVLYPIRRQASVYGLELTESRQAQYRTVSEFLSGLKIAKSFNAEPRYFAELSSILERMRENYDRFVRLNSVTGVVFQSTTAIGLAVFVYVALTVFSMAMPKIVVLVFLFMRVSPRIMGLQSYIQEVLSNLPAFYVMKSMRAECDREREGVGGPKGDVPMLVDEARFEKVTFRYSPEPSSCVLTDVSFTIPARQITALIGPSGSGKSTTADLLMGLLEPTGGVSLSTESR